MREPSTITLNGRKYPIICNLNVLEKLQEKYKSVNNFELKLLGIVLQRDEEGELLYTKDGEPVLLSAEPSIEAVKAALFAMVREGERVKAYLDGKGEPIFTEPEELLGDCDMSFTQLSEVLHGEYKRCFASKKH